MSARIQWAIERLPMAHEWVYVRMLGFYCKRHRRSSFAYPPVCPGTAIGAIAVLR